MTETNAPRPNVTLDMRGTSCPAPLLGAKKLVDDLRPGEVLVLLSDCPGTSDDLFAWAKYTGNHVARTERLPDGSHAFHIERGRSRHPAAHAVLDLRGATCPGPIVEAKKLLNGMRSGETLKLVSNCPGIGADVADWVKATGLKLIAAEEIAAGEFEFYIGKQGK
jgi:TusA-related sulfurtransferase